MPKRFTDSEKWKKPFIRGLKAPYKLLWFYITDECDPSGIWQVDFEVAQIKIGEKLKESDALKFFVDKIFVLPGNDKWFIPSFIEFQYGLLSENNRAHTKIILTLKKLNLLNLDLTIKPLTSPLQGAKVEVKEEEMDKEVEKEKEVDEKKTKPKRELVYPWPTDVFIEKWNIWKEYKKEQHKFEYKSIITEQSALKELARDALDEQTAIDSIEYTMGKGWKGIVIKKSELNGQQATKNGTGAILNADYKRDLAERIAIAAGKSGQFPN